jgi:endoglucanase
VTARLAAAALSACLFLQAESVGAAEQAPGASKELRVAPSQKPTAETQTNEMIRHLASTWFKSEWRAYREAFVSPDGRVIDNGNAGVSHSEGQGYGLLLAAFADDRDHFELIWNWTDKHLKVRWDNLLAWRWNPADRTIDKNNATDGDMLVAWALAEGAKRFNRPDYAVVARSIAEAIGAHAIAKNDDRIYLLPAVEGFDAKAQPDGPVVNLSYWVFPAFSTLQELAPEYDWAGLKLSGLKILGESRFGPLRLPTDWQSLKETIPHPAQKFPAEFGYNAIRLPLYLLWSGEAEALRAAQRFDGLWSGKSDVGPFVVSVSSGDANQSLDGAGYKIVLSLARCVTLGREIDPDLTKTRDHLYYPATLRMLSLAVIQERFPQCL